MSRKSTSSRSATVSALVRKVGRSRVQSGTHYQRTFVTRKPEIAPRRSPVCDLEKLNAALNDAWCQSRFAASPF
jgi:hypothetical protein